MKKFVYFCIYIYILKKTIETKLKIDLNVIANNISLLRKQQEDELKIKETLELREVFKVF
jgi:hypothetical protein